MAQKSRLRVAKIFPSRSGVTKSGREWHVKELLTLTFGKFPSELFVLLTSKRDVILAEKYLSEGDVIQTEFRPYSKLFEGKYYTTMGTYGLQILDEDFKPKFKTERTADEDISDEDYEDINVAF